MQAMVFGFHGHHVKTFEEGVLCRIEDVWLSDKYYVHILESFEYGVGLGI